MYLLRKESEREANIILFGRSDLLFDGMKDQAWPVSSSTFFVFWISSLLAVIIVQTVTFIISDIRVGRGEIGEIDWNRFNAKEKEREGERVGGSWNENFFSTPADRIFLIGSRFFTVFLLFLSNIPLDMHAYWVARRKPVLSRRHTGKSVTTFVSRFCVGEPKGYIWRILSDNEMRSRHVSNDSS